MTRCQFWVGLALVASMFAGEARAADDDRPNILWITCEDISTNLGCYGDKYAVTPNLDKLATEGVRYDRAYAPIGVCAPARSTLITGMYPPSIGTQHMRCQGMMPKEAKTYSQLLREAGYYCTNNSKTDYNMGMPKGCWDDSSGKAHWRNRKAGQPFFAIFNFTTCHESQIRLAEAAYQKRVAEFTDKEKHDPAKAPIPPYHPDTPEVRKDWARYADMITYMDKQAGDILAQLDKDGLADNTIVFFYSDHGAGMPRSKRWLYETSTQVPFIVRFPKKYADWAPGKPGSSTERLVNFVDFGPTALSLAGVKIPAIMQGKPFLGKQAAKPREYVYGFRDRMDERYDMLRSVRDKKYRYIRNYMPHLPYFHTQHLNYAYQMPTLRVWETLSKEGKLKGPQAVFMAQTKPPEELYDVEADPFEVNNLVNSKEHQDVLERLRKALTDWQAEIIDLSFLPEGDLRTRFGNTPPYDAVRQNPASYPYAKISAAADLASRLDPANVEKLTALLKDEDQAVRFWAATGLGALGDQAKAAKPALLAATQDKDGNVRVAAGDALCRLGDYETGVRVLAAAMKDPNEWVRLAAINHLDRLGDKAKGAEDAIRAALKDKNSYVVRVAEHANGK
ncbi:MAG: sulfatase-like hydrolase/transferase [Gemmataceae bacterium]